MVFFIFVFEASFLGDAGGLFVSSRRPIPSDLLRASNARDPIDGTV